MTTEHKPHIRLYRWFTEPVTCLRGWPYLAIASITVLVLDVWLRIIL